MNINEWLDDNVFDADVDLPCVEVKDLLELLKTHAIVPRELSDSIINKTPCRNIRAGVKRKIHKAMIKAAEND